MADEQYECAKCAGIEFDTAEIRTTGAGLSRFFNLQSHKFAAILCSGCGYTELYRMHAGGRAAKVLDVLTN